MKFLNLIKPRKKISNLYKIKNILGFNTGVYYFKNKINNKCYIGSSSNLRNRKNTHLCDLKNNRHHSVKFQRAYNQYGIDNFEYGIIEYCTPDFLQQAETEWLKYFDSYNNGYNSTDEVGAPWRGKRQPEEIKKRQKCIPVKLISPEGDVVEDYSVNNFSKQRNLATWCISKVLKGEYQQYKGWRKHSKELEGVKFNFNKYRQQLGLNSKICKKYKIIDPKGNLITGKNILNLCRKNNLDAGAILLVLKGIKKHHQGWRIYNKTNFKIPFNWLGSYYRFQKQTFSFKHINNIVEKDIMLDDFCNKYFLKRGTVIALINKRLKTHKGWSVCGQK
jgi:group I intron endonuclease